MRCLYCGKQLALLRRLTVGGEFCSEAHKQSYHEEYNKLALSRLLQAQSKPEDIRGPVPPPEVISSPSREAAKTIEATQPMSRDPHTGWTTVHKSDLKRLPSPAPAAATAQAPSAPGFLPDKPQLLKAGTLAAERVPVSQSTARSASGHQVSHPRLDCQPIEYRASAPPRAAKLLRLSGVQTQSFRKPLPRTQLSPVQDPASQTISRNALSSAQMDAGFARFGMLPPELHPVQASKAESELEPALAFRFSSYLEEPPRVCFLADGAELPEDDDLQLSIIGCGVADFIERPEPVLEVDETVYAFAGLLPLTVQPSVPVSLEPAIRLAAMSAGNGGPTLPVNSPLPLRPKVAEPTAGRISRPRTTARPSESALSSSVAIEPPPSGEQAASSQEPEIELPAFLKAATDQDPERSMWGNVQKYIKNIVSCLLVAGLGGALYWHFKDNPPIGLRASVFNAIAPIVPDRTAHDGSRLDQQPSGEADRVRPGRQIFIYPATMAIQDYRAEFEISAAPKAAEWVFRVSDPRNCYGMRLEAQPDAHKWSVQKYVFIDGERVLSSTFPLPPPSDEGSYKLAVEVQGSLFLTYAQGRPVDRWVDERFTRGGFGYYSDGSNPAPVRLIRISDLGPAAHARPERRD